MAPQAKRGYSSRRTFGCTAVTVQPDPRINSLALTITPVPKRFTGTVITRCELPHDTETEEDIRGQAEEQPAAAYFSTNRNMQGFS